MTRAEFDEKYASSKIDEIVAIHCKTEDDAINFLSLAEEFDCFWDYKGDKPTNETYFQMGDDDGICYNVDLEGALSYFNLNYASGNNYKVIVFDEEL